MWYWVSQKKTCFWWVSLDRTPFHQGEGGGFADEVVRGDKDRNENEYIINRKKRNGRRNE